MLLDVDAPRRCLRSLSTLHKRVSWDLKKWRHLVTFGRGVDRVDVEVDRAVWVEVGGGRRIRV